MKKKLNISFSGGLTSAYMTKWMVDNLSDEYDFIITFANTGLEHEKTLEFVHNCDKYFGFNTIWIEAVVHHGKRLGCTHRIVTFDTAKREAEPFEEVIKKYGFPNLSYLHCTRELKLNPMVSYLRELNLWGEIPIAIGIRNDETRRVNKKAAQQNIIYPLVDMHPTTKREVWDFWSKQPFTLGLEEFEGNCKGCFKKSYKKQYLQIEKIPTVFNFWKMMEHLYQKERKFFKGNLSTDELFEQSRMLGESQRALEIITNDEDGGCSESCEVFNLEDMD